jgi:hypothetical protein
MPCSIPISPARAPSVETTTCVAFFISAPYRSLANFRDTRFLDAGGTDFHRLA